MNPLKMPVLSQPGLLRLPMPCEMKLPKKAAPFCELTWRLSSHRFGLGLKTAWLTRMVRVPDQVPSMDGTCEGADEDWVEDVDDDVSMEGWDGFRSLDSLQANDRAATRRATIDR